MDRAVVNVLEKNWQRFGAVRFCILLMLMTVLVLSCTCGQTVNGEVFVVTKAAGNIKLGLVTVSFLTARQYAEASDPNSAVYRAAVDYYNALDSMANYEHCYKLYLFWLNEAGTQKQIGELYAESAKKYKNEEGHLQVLGPEFKDKADASYARAVTYSWRADSLMREATAHTRLSSDSRALRRIIDSYLISHGVITDKSNSDGKFSVNLKKQKYYVYANSTRAVMDSEEQYHWLFEYIPDGKSLFLSNDNLSQ